MLELEASNAPQAREAIDYFTHRVRMEIGALAGALRGFDGLVFTGGIGEHSARVRASVVEGLRWLGLDLDADANKSGGPRISTTASAMPILALRTDEEAMIARHAIKAAGLARALAV